VVTIARSAHLIDHLMQAVHRHISRPEKVWQGLLVVKPVALGIVLIKKGVQPSHVFSPAHHLANKALHTVEG
jgi:hypothetical protein